MRTDMTVRPHMTPERHSEGYKIVIAIRNLWDENDRLSRSLPDLNQRIEANIHAFMERFDLTLGEWHLWCHSAKRH